MPGVVRKKRPTEALAYNGVVQSWTVVMRLAREGVKARPKQAQMFTETGAEAQRMAIRKHERVGKAMELFTGCLGP